jgi:hypothetical protein
MTLLIYGGLALALIGSGLWASGIHTAPASEDEWGEADSDRPERPRLRLVGFEDANQPDRPTLTVVPGASFSLASPDASIGMEEPL